MTVPTRVAVLGAGFISDYHVEGLRAAGAEVVAIASAGGASARARAAHHGIPIATEDWRGLLGRRDVDAVVVATPDWTHEDLAVAAVQAGKAALVQKPMGRSAAECRRMIEAATRAGTLLCVAFLHRYAEEVEALRALLGRDALGPVGFVRHRNATAGADWAAWFYGREKVGGGVVQQLGAHGIDLLRHLFGEVVEVQATVARTRRERTLADGSVVRPDNEDLAVATYRFASGLVAQHEMSYTEVAGTDRFRMEVYGARGTAWVRSERGRLAVYAADGTAPAVWATPELAGPDVGRRQHEHFVRMVRQEAPPDGSDRAGLAVALVAEAIYRAAASGRRERVERA